MIEVGQSETPGFLEIRMTGEITAEDYEETLTPAIEDALAKSDSLRILAILDEEFQKFDLRAAWQDAELGMSHWRGFDRMALVTDVGWAATSARVFGLLMPCPTQVFALSRLDEARRWLRESLGAVHLRDLGGDVIQIQLLGKLDPEALDTAQGDLEAKLRGKDSFRLLLDLREFDGWRGVSALGSHFDLVRRNALMLKKAAVLGDAAWQDLAQRAMGRLMSIETKYFAADDADAARSWIAAD